MERNTVRRLMMSEASCCSITLPREYAFRLPSKADDQLFAMINYEELVY
jgi:hypothetical protein